MEQCDFRDIFFRTHILLFHTILYTPLTIPNLQQHVHLHNEY